MSDDTEQDHGQTGAQGEDSDAPLTLAGFATEPRLVDARNLIGPGAPDRWRPVRAGIRNIYGYEDQVFSFDDGLCLLRGRNGSGKSIAQSLLFPFLFDAQLGAGRMSHGRPTGSMKNLLLVRQGSEDAEDATVRYKHESRAGYVWATFVRPGADGGPGAAISIGCGARATKASDADSWFFVTTRQPGFDLDLAPGGEPLSRLNLALELGDALPPPVSTPPAEWGPAPETVPVRRAEGRRGRERVSSPCVFETREAYQAALDRALFGMGVDRLRKAVDLILVLRRPQLGERDAEAISDALSHALAPLTSSAIARIAAGFEDLDALRRRLAELEVAAAAFTRAAEPQRRYLRLAAAARATGVERARRAAVEARREARIAGVRAGDKTRAAGLALEERDRLRDLALAAQEHRRGLLDSPAYAELANLQDLDGRIDDLRTGLDTAKGRVEDLEGREGTLQGGLARLTGELDTKVKSLRDRLGQASVAAEAATLTPSVLGLPVAGTDADELLGLDADRWRSAVGTVRLREAAITSLLELIGKAAEAEAQVVTAQGRFSEEDDAVETLEGRCDQAGDGLEASRDALAEEVLHWWARVSVASADAGADPGSAERLAGIVAVLEADASEFQRGLTEALSPLRSHLDARDRDLRAALGDNEAEVSRLEEVRAEVEALADLPPQRAEWRDASDGLALWQLVDPADSLDDQALAGIEAALGASGLLDVTISAEGTLQVPGAAALAADLRARVGSRAAGASLAEVLVAAPGPDSGIDAEAVVAVLEAIPLAAPGQDPALDLWVSTDGRFRVGPAVGNPAPGQAQYLGAPARAAHRQARLDEIDAQLGQLAQEHQRLGDDLEAVAAQRSEAAEIANEAPSERAVRDAWQHLDRLQSQLEGARERRTRAEEALERAQAKVVTARRQVLDAARERGLPSVGERLEALAVSAAELVELLLHAASALEAAQSARQAVKGVEGQLEQLAEDLTLARDERNTTSSKLDGLVARRDAILSALGEDPAEIQAKVERAGTTATRAEEAARDAETAWSEATEEAATAAAAAESARTQAEAAEALHEAALAAAESLRQPVLAAAFASPDQAPAAPPADEVGDADHAAGASTDGDVESGTGLALAWQGSDGVERIVEIVLREARDELAQVMAEHGIKADAPDLVERVTTDAERALQAASTRLVEDVIGGWYTSYAVTGGFREIRVGSTERGETSLFEAVAEVGRQLEEHASRITRDEQALFTDHIFRSAATEIQSRLQDTDVFVEQVNASLAEARTSSELSLSLRWDVDVEDASSRRVVEMMRQDPAQLSERSRELVRDHSLARIATMRAENPELSYNEVLPVVFDYRLWHRFTVRLHHPDGTSQVATRSVMKSLSGGEAANAIHQPLFAALDAHYRGADPAAPRMLTLDEAFAGIDDSLRGALMGLLVDWRFDALIASHEMWGTFAEVPALRIYDLRRMPPSEAVHAQEFRWNGRVLTGTVDAA